MIKNIITIILGISILGVGAYLYNEGDNAVMDTSILVQNETLITEALNVLEDCRESKGINYYISRQYELPEQTLWEIHIQKYGAKQTCSILEQHPETNITVDSTKLDDVAKLLESNDIKYKIHKSLG